MYNIEIESDGTEKTLEIGEKFANYLQKGDVVVLTGNLGSGKTKFVEGFLKKYNLQDEISSPTFNIINEYVNNENKIYHFDVYRLEEIDEFYSIGGDEYFENGICLIEWGELIIEALPKDYIHIFINKDFKDDNKRIFKFVVKDDSKYIDVLKKLKEDLN